MALRAARVAAALAAACVVALIVSSARPSSTVLSQYPPHKILPLDGDYPGGRTGIPIDSYPEYLGLDTAHGVTHYFGEPNVVTGPNSVEFGSGFARRPRRTGLWQVARRVALAEEGEEEGQESDVGPSRRAGGYFQYAPVSNVPVATRPDAACYQCLQQDYDNWQLYAACSSVCVVSDCVNACEARNAGGQFGPDVPVFVSEMCMGECRVPR